MSPADSGALNRRAALASVSVALILSGLKTWAALETGSIAMLGSLADTGLDLVASLVTLIAVHIAAQPADHEHRFGHGKAEALAALFQVSLISIAALLILIRSAEQIGGGGAPGQIGTGIGVSIVAIALTFALLAYQAAIIARTGSVAIGADNLHYKSDLILNLSVIAALLIDSLLAIRGADALFGIAIGLWLAWGAWRTATHAIDQLMDKEWPLEKRARFLEIAARHPAVKGIHDLRTRTSGTHDFVQFHIWLDPALTLQRAHDIIDDIETWLADAFPGVEVLIHADPEGQNDTGDPIAERDAQALIADLQAAEDKKV